MLNMQKYFGFTGVTSFTHLLVFFSNYFNPKLPPLSEPMSAPEINPKLSPPSKLVPVPEINSKRPPPSEPMPAPENLLVEKQPLKDVREAEKGEIGYHGKRKHETEIVTEVMGV